MPKLGEYRNSILIVSGSEQINAVIKRVLSESGVVYVDLDIKKNAVLGRRAVLEKKYDLIIINAPLSEEIGYDLALDISEQQDASILIIAPTEIYDSVTEYVSDQGILVIPKPLQEGMLNRAIRFLSAVQGRFRRYESRVTSLEDKLEELKLVSRAKILLMEKKHLSEKEAHRLIGKEAMDHGVSRKRVAESIIENFE